MWLGVHKDLPQEYEKHLIEGIVKPDELMWRGSRRYRVRHHSAGGIVFDRIKRARYYYLKGDMPSCLYNLGFALHFIQDAHIPSPRTRYLRKVHDSIERRMRRLPIPEDVIDAGFDVAELSPAHVKRILSEVRWERDPESALLRAVWVSAVITAAVFGPREAPEGLREEYLDARRRHRRHVAAGWIVFLVGSVLSFLLLPLSVALLMPFLLGFISVAIVLSDRRFYELNELAFWYGIEKYNIV